MREKFVAPSQSGYHQAFVRTSASSGRFEFGAQSEIGTYHFHGAEETRRSKTGKVFTWALPKRDMVSKTPEQIDEMQVAFVDWFKNERLPQIRRICAQHLRGGLRA